MKKHLRKALSAFLGTAILLSGMGAFAQTPMQIEWSGDYSDNTKPTVTVSFVSPAEYVQEITAVIYDKDIANPATSDYVRIAEVTTSDKEKKDLVFNITNAFSETDGAYTIRLKGNGHKKDECIDSASLYVIKPGAIPGILNDFKNTAIFETTLSKVMDALQLDAEADGARRAKRIEIMINMQANDFGGGFATLEDVRLAWKISDTIAYITDAGSTAEGIKERVENNASLIGADTQNADYIAFIDDACAEILAYSSEYNQNGGVKSLKDLRGILNQYIGLNAVNAASEETLYGVFEGYKNYFELPTESFNKYNNFSRENKDKALRLINNKNFAKNADLVTAFVNGVAAAETAAPTTTTPPVIVIPPTGGGTSGSSGGGASLSTPPVSAPTTPEAAKTPSFKDVPSNHWAYSSVTTLAQKGIINGYDDDTFKPNNKVTREEFVKMIVGATGLVVADTACDFADVPENAWFYEYVASAFAAGVVSGIDETTFGVGRNITRQDVAVIAARILDYLKPGAYTAAETTLTDIDSVSDYAVQSVKLLNNMGIINGYDDGSFMPRNELTRAEAAAIISKLAESL